MLDFLNELGIKWDEVQTFFFSSTPVTILFTFLAFVRKSHFVSLLTYIFFVLHQMGPPQSDPGGPQGRRVGHMRGVGDCVCSKMLTRTNCRRGGGSDVFYMRHMDNTCQYGFPNSTVYIVKDHPHPSSAHRDGAPGRTGGRAAGCSAVGSCVRCPRGPEAAVWGQRRARPPPSG